jgi:hypothetical protein
MSNLAHVPAYSFYFYPSLQLTILVLEPLWKSFIYTGTIAKLKEYRRDVGKLGIVASGLLR